MRCYLFPIEPHDRRYTAQWLDWFPPALTAAGFEVDVVHPDVASGDVTTEEFLDPLQTHAYKAAQVQEFVRRVRRDEPAAVVFLDAWHPGTVSLAYMRDVERMPLHLLGIMHAGCYDPHDLLSRRGLGRWALGFERSAFQALDEVTVSCEFHRGLIEATHPNAARYFIHPIPVRSDVVAPRERDRIVVWPHRVAPEKQGEVWRGAVASLRGRYPEWEFVETLSRPRSKAEYHALLSRSYLAVSAALQETFGIAMVEAAQLGCDVLAPPRLAYPELFPARCLEPVDTVEDMAAAIARRLDAFDGVTRAPTDCLAVSERVRRADTFISEHWAERVASSG